MLVYDSDMIAVEHGSGFQRYVGCIVAVYQNGGIILAISPSLLVVLLPSEFSSLHDMPWLAMFNVV